MYHNSFSTIFTGVSDSVHIMVQYQNPLFHPCFDSYPSRSPHERIPQITVRCNRIRRDGHLARYRVRHSPDFIFAILCRCRSANLHYAEPFSPKPSRHVESGRSEKRKASWMERPSPALLQSSRFVFRPLPTPPRWTVSPTAHAKEFDSHLHVITVAPKRLAVTRNSHVETVVWPEWNASRRINDVPVQ